MTPHPNAQALHALIDGEEVQCREIASPPLAWEVVTLADARDMGRYILHDDVYEWRLKPATLRYRVAKFKSGADENLRHVAVADTEAGAAAYERSPRFIEWLGDWQEVEA